MKRIFIKLSLLLITGMVVLPAAAFASGIDIIGDYLVKDLTRQYASGKKADRGKIYVSVLPFEIDSVTDDSQIVARELLNSLTENISHDSFFTLVDSGRGEILTDKNYRDPESTIQRYFRNKLGMNRARHCYINGSISDDAFGYIAMVSLVDAASGQKVASRQVRILHADVQAGLKKNLVNPDSGKTTGIRFDVKDSYLQSPANVMAWIRDIYLRLPLYGSLSLKLGISNVYREVHDDISLLARETYPHFMTSPLDGFNNFNPTLYMQITQRVVNKCSPFIGLDYTVKANRTLEVRLGFNTSLFSVAIPTKKAMSINPYADLMKCDEDVRNVLDGKYSELHGTGNEYPQVMFRIEAEPRFLISNNTVVSLFVAWYYTPTLDEESEYYSEEFGNPLVAPSVPFMGLSLKLSCIRLF